MRKIAVFALVVLALIGCRKAPVRQDDKITRVDAAQAPCSGNDPPPPKTRVEGWPAKRISELAPGQGGRVDIEGVVTFSFVPRPCPQGAMCKPQMGAHIQLPETAEGLEPLILYTPDPKSVPANVPIRVSAELCANRSSGSIEGELRGWMKKE